MIAFVSTSNGSNMNRRDTVTVCNMGYKFGDISRSIGKKFTSAVNQQTGKDKYEFGDLTKWLDKKAKAQANALTGKDDYEFGDLSRWVDAKVKDKVNSLSGKSEYEFGDLSKEILRRVLSGEYEFGDIVILCKILLSFGVGLSPVSTFFPTKFLIEFLNFSIAEDVGGRLVGALAQEVDRRVKKAITGDENYQLGDLAKKQILKYTNKDEYTFGDITKTIITYIDENPGKSPKLFLQNTSSAELDADVLKALEKWDIAYDLDLSRTKDSKKNESSS